MGDVNPIYTLRDYSKPRHEGYMNTIEIPVGYNVVPLRSDTIRLVQNGCLFYGLRFEDPNQHLKDFLKLVDSLDLDRSITTWEDLTTRFLAQFFLSGRIAKLRYYPDQDDTISKINLLWKFVSEKLDDTPIRDTAGNPVAQMNFTSTNDPIREDLQGKGIKSPSKLISLKYLSQSSLVEKNRNLSSPKRVHVEKRKVDETKEERNVKTNTTEYEDHEMTVENEEEFEEETKDEIEEKEEDSPKHFDTFPNMKELRYHEMLLKKPSTLWVKAKVRTKNLNNVKFSCMVGHFFKKQAYLDMESPINVMSRIHYNWIMIKRLGPRRKPSNLGKIYNFVGRVKGLNFFVGNFTYECDFMVLEDTTSVIDHDIGLVIFGKPFVEATSLIYDGEEGTIKFKKDKEKIVFKMPHKMEMFKHIDFTDIKNDHIPPFAVEIDDDSSEKIHYSDSLDLGSEYKHDEKVCKAIQSLTFF
nr:protein kinase-like domain, concanavalin A-like lectin/glucanase domain protein [Tanacetum cinerariifolium]